MICNVLNPYVLTNMSLQLEYDWDVVRFLYFHEHLTLKVLNF